MNIKYINKYLLSFACLIFLASGVGVSFLGSSVSAIESEDQPNVRQPKAMEDKQKASNSLNLEQKRGQRGKLNDSRLKRCQQRKEAINKLLSQMAAGGERKIAVINKISERVQTFYTDNNFNVENYDELLAAVNSKKAAAEAAAALVKSSSVAFRCEGDDPQGAGQAFKDNLKKLNAALREYKAAVKNLTRAVKAASTSAGGQQ